MSETRVKPSSETWGEREGALGKLKEMNGSPALECKHRSFPLEAWEMTQ